MRKPFVPLAVLIGLLPAGRLAAGELPPPTRAAGADEPDGGLRRRAIIGVKLAPVTTEVRERQKLDGDGGVVVEQVLPGTAAAGGLREGDVILAVGGAKVNGVAALVETVAEARAGDVLTLDVIRDGVRAEKRVTLKERPRPDDQRGPPPEFNPVLLETLRAWLEKSSTATGPSTRRRTEELAAENDALWRRLALLSIAKYLEQPDRAALAEEMKRWLERPEGHMTIHRGRDAVTAVEHLRAHDKSNKAYAAIDPKTVVVVFLNGAIGGGSRIGVVFDKADATEMAVTHLPGK